MDGYDLTNFGFFSNFWPRLVAHRSWYTIQGHLPDDLKPIGTHLGPKERTDKLIFLSEINRHSWPPTHYNGQLRFSQFWTLSTLCPRQVGHRNQLGSNLSLAYIEKTLRALNLYL